jgi:PA14 domain
MGRNISSFAVLRALATAALLAAAALTDTAAFAQAAGGIKIFSPQPAADVVKPGLTVRYYSPKLRYIDEFVRFVRIRPGTPGENIPALNYADKGHGANVLGTNQAEMVGAVIDGLIKFEEPGTYQFAMVANDLVRLQIGEALVIEKDWDGMPTQMGDSVNVAIAQPGWYRLHVMYFQRKGTAALELYWKRPGQMGNLQLVPAEAFAHIPE